MGVSMVEYDMIKDLPCTFFGRRGGVFYVNVSLYVSLRNFVWQSVMTWLVTIAAT